MTAEYSPRRDPVQDRLYKGALRNYLLRDLAVDIELGHVQKALIANGFGADSSLAEFLVVYSQEYRASRLLGTPIRGSKSGLLKRKEGLDSVRKRRKEVGQFLFGDRSEEFLERIRTRFITTSNYGNNRIDINRRVLIQEISSRFTHSRYPAPKAL